jgi:hypothetical protein
MQRPIVYLLAWGWSVALWALPLPARAEFIIEFHDGHKVTVGHYFEEGKTIKVYTPQGAIGFPKSEVKRILSADEDRGGDSALEASLGHHHEATSSAETSANADEGKAKTKVRVEKQAGHPDSQAEREELTTQYHDVAKKLDSVWGKHLEDVERGVPIEQLEENRRQMNALNHQRNELIRSARRGNDVPDWAQ